MLFAVTLQIGLTRSVARDLTGDEHWTRLLARLPLSESLPFIIQDGKHPPLYPVLQMIGALVLPDTTLGLRLFSLLAVSLVPVVLYWMARKLGQTRVVALAMAFWVAFHPVLLTEAVNARSYALLALMVALYASALVRWVLAPAHGDRLVLQMAVFASLASLLHAFGILFVLPLLAAALLYLRTVGGASTFWAKQGHGRVLVQAHAAAVVLAVGWFLAITLTTRGSGGIESGLQWLSYPDNSERLYALGLLLGNPGFPRGTTVYLGLWGAAFAIIFWVAATRRVWPFLGVMIITAGLAPFIAQVLASGLVVTAPLWGLRHVTPAPILVAMGVLVALRTITGARSVQLGISTVFATMAVMSIMGMQRSSRNGLSQFAARMGASADSTPIRVTDEYGALSSFNFHFDRRCLDTRQLRVQFPQVVGLAATLPRGAHCRAEALEGRPLPADTRMFLLHRSFVPNEVEARAHLIEGGWRVVAATGRGENGEPIIELLERVPPPSD